MSGSVRGAGKRLRNFASAHSTALSFVPIVVLMALAYVVPLASNISQSFCDKSGNYVGFQNYVDVLTSYYFLDSLLFTLKVAVLSTAIAMVVAVVCALALRQTFVGKKLVVFMFQHNLGIPRMAAAMMAIMLISQTGFISNMLRGLGVIEKSSEFPLWIFDSSGIGLIAVFAWKFFPYIGLSALSVLQGASVEYEQQASVLGVGPFKRFWHVTLPMIVPATSIASIIMFASAFGDYEMSQILGSSSHRMLSVFTYLKYCDSSMQNKPEAYVLMVIMTIILACIILVYRKATMTEKEARS